MSMVLDRCADQDVLPEADAAEAMPKWRLVQGRMHLVVRFADFRRAASFVAKIGEMAEDADHHPEIDIRCNRVHLALSSHDVDGITCRDVRLGNAIVPLIKIFDGAFDPAPFSETQITIDTADVEAIRPFWAAVYGYHQVDDGDLVDPARTGPRIFFKPARVSPLERNRVHVDIFVPADQAEERVAAGLAAGGRLTDATQAPSWWVLADAEGNEACICTWQPAPAAVVQHPTTGSRIVPSADHLTTGPVAALRRRG